MAEYTAIAAQTVAANSNILFTEEPVGGGKCINHREGSGIVTLRGITSQCRARYKVSFNGNIAIPAGGTVGAVSAAIAMQGEALASSVMITTPAAVSEYSNVSASTFIDVPCSCCTTVTVKNISTQAIEVVNANLVIERVA